MADRKAVTLFLKRVAHRAVYSHVGMETGVARRVAEFRTRRSPAAVFIWIPKSAGTSLLELLLRNSAMRYLSYEHIRLVFPSSGIATFGHINYSLLRDDGLISEHFDTNAYKFSIVRNPFDRAVSLYLHMQRVERIPAAMRFEMFTELIREGNIEGVGRKNVCGLSQCNPQMAWLQHDPDLRSTHIGRFEDLDSFIKKLNDRLSLEGPLPRSNVSPDRDHYRSYYSSRSAREDVEDYYATDLEKFDYDF